MEYLIRMLTSSLILLLIASCDSKGMTTDPNPWKLVKVSGAYCGNGAPVNMASFPSPEPTGKLLIYLQSGGACWDDVTCDYNSAVYTSTGITDSDVLRDAEVTATAGVLDRTSQSNSFRNDDFAYIPYCTGDVHSGSKTQAGSTGVRHSGGQNLLVFIEQGILPKFPDIDEVYLVGASAGGFGSIIMYESIKDLFGAIPVHLLSDGGMPLPTTPVLTDSSNFRTMAGFQQLLKTNWGYNIYLNLESDYIEDSFGHIAETNTDRRFGLISSLDDTTIQRFIEAGMYGILEFDTFTETDWRNAMSQIQSLTDTHENSNGFFHQSQQHVFIRQNTDNFIIGTTSLTEWLEQFRSGVDWQSYTDL